MIQNEQHERVSAKVKAKLVLKAYLEAFNLTEDCEDYDELKRTEPAKVQAFVDKLLEGLYKKLVVKNDNESVKTNVVKENE